MTGSNAASLVEKNTGNTDRGQFTSRGRAEFSDRGRGYFNRGRVRGRGYSDPRASCLNTDSERQSGYDETRLNSVAGCTIQNTEGLHHCCVVDSKVPLKCGHDLPLLSAACKHGKDRGCHPVADSVMPVEIGFVGNHSVSVLRDSGCSTAIVKRSLVEMRR